MASPVGSGVNRHTGRPVHGWEHVVLCLEAIFSTPFGSRVMRRWVGSLVPHMLGENIVPETMLRFFTALYAALVFEPRFNVEQINILSSPDELRTGRLRIEANGQYRPRAHVGDFTVEGPRTILIMGASDNRPIVVEG